MNEVGQSICRASLEERLFSRISPASAEVQGSRCEGKPPPGVTFPAWKDGDCVPLIELLLVVGRWVLGANWYLRNAEFATGWRGSRELNVMSGQVNPTPTIAFVDLVSDGVQMIDGELLAFRPGHHPPSAPIATWTMSCSPF
jgi:hypothetical protein